MAFTPPLSRRLTLTLAAGTLLAAALLCWAALQKHETTLEIRAVSQGAMIPDAFPSGTISTPMAFVLKALRPRITSC